MEKDAWFGSKWIKNTAREAAEAAMQPLKNELYDAAVVKKALKALTAHAILTGVIAGSIPTSYMIGRDIFRRNKKRT